MHFIACFFGPISVILFYGIFLVIWISAGFLFKVQNRKFWFVASIPVFAIGFIVFALYQYRPEAIFERAFGFPPGPDVAIYNSQDWYFADTGTIYLKFTAGPDTINQIVNRGLAEESQTNNPCIDTNVSPPNWWMVEPQDSTTLYTGHFEKNNLANNSFFLSQQDFSSESECLYYNHTSQIAHYMFLGID